MSIKSKVLAAAALAVAAVAVPALPALASATFVVTVNGNADVTRQPLTLHEVITCGGVAYTVQSVQGSGTYEVTLTPHLAATAVCSA